jgi:hypothetical protein
MYAIQRKSDGRFLNMPKGKGNSQTWMEFGDDKPNHHLPTSKIPKIVRTKKGANTLLKLWLRGCWGRDNGKMKVIISRTYDPENYHVVRVELAVICERTNFEIEREERSKSSVL